MASGELTSKDYITHHLTNLTVGSGFWTLHLDTFLISGILGLVVFGAMAAVAGRATMSRSAMRPRSTFRRRTSSG